MPESVGQFVCDQIARQAEEQAQAASTSIDSELTQPATSSSSKLLARLRRTRRNAKISTNGSFRSKDSSDPTVCNDELVWRDNTLTWARGCKLIRTFQFEQPVFQAFWASMEVDSPDQLESPPSQSQPGSSVSQHATATSSPTILKERGPFSAMQRNLRNFAHVLTPSDLRNRRSSSLRVYERALCVCFEMGLFIHLAHRGEQYNIDLPFRLAKAFPLPVGLILQRQTETEDVEIADRIEKHYRSYRNDPDSSSFDAYPFPSVPEPDSQLKTPEMLQVPLDVGSLVEEEQHLASTILPMAFHLRRPFDELAQVDRYPQLSHSLSGEDNTDDYLLHGPSSPFTQVDEKICFVSPSGSDKSGFCLLITASHRSRSIRLYSAATQPTRPQSTPVILSSRLSSNKVSLLAQSSDPQAAPSSSAGGSSRDPFPTADLDDASQAPLSSGGPLHRRKSSGNGLHSLGRGAPSTRKSGRIDLERRQSSMGSTMGRDASGRSRRISAMHAGNAERRLVGRGDDTLPSGRDRVPTGNMSQTVDGLRRQSQNYAQESMLDDLAGANTSMLMTGSLQPGTRLRRTSHAARGIYTAPRASSRPSAAMARVRSSMSMTRGDSTSMEADFDMTAFGAPNRTGLSLYEHETMEPNDPSVAVGHLDNPQTLTDLDDFARGFAAVSLLEEIKVDELQQPDLVDQIHAFLAPHSRGIELVYISVPATGKTFCRLISTRTYPAESQVLRTCLTSRLPDAKMASSSIPSAMIASVRTMGSIGTEIISVRDDGSLELSFGSIAASAHSLQLGPWARWARSKSGDDSSTSTDKVTSVKASRSNGILITTEMSKSPIELDLDFRPRCQLTSKVLKSLALVLDPDRYQELRAAWVRRRFGLDNPIGQRDVLLFDHDWVVLTALLAKEKARNHDIQPWSGIFSDLTRSVSHFHYADESLLDGIKTFQAERAPSTPRSPTPLAQELTTDETAAVAAMLHLLAQDARLDTVDARNEVAKLSELLMQLASSCKDSTMLDYWARLRPQANPSLHLSRGSSLSLLTRNSEPPFDIYDVLMSQLNGKRRETVASLFKRLHNRSPSTESFEDELNKVCHRSYQLLELFASQSSSSASVNSSISTSRAHQMVTRMTALGLEADRIRRLPFGLALPLLEAIRTCQIDPPIGWKPDAYLTVHRADLALLAMPSSSGHSMNLSHPVSKSFLKTLPRNVAMDPLSAQIFSKDFRLAEVAKMLQTTESNTVYVAEGEGLSESAVVELHNRAVMGLAERTKAIPVGRGMLLMASKPFQVTRKWDIPRLCLSVKVIPRGTTIKPESKPESAAQEWPEFHNGVASILEISVPANARIDSKWIFSHLGEEPTAKHAGFLFGLGLTKHLPALTPVHVFRYLRTRHNLLTIGFLLGLAAASVGTGDPAARHLLGMQLVAFLPSGSAPLNLSVITQTAGLLAMGIVFLGSNHRWTAKRLLQQIGAVESPIPDIQPQHREAYSLSAGMALGLVMLGKGRQDGMSSVPDKRILARLEELVNGKQGRLVRPKASADFRQTQADEELSLTSIPASVALALIFLRSNRKDIAELLALPKADAELNFVRPDVLLIRVLARYLILWDQIEPTEVWIHSVLPEWMRALGKSKSGLSEAAQLAHINIRAGACFAIGLKHAGSHDTKARACLMEQLIALSQDAKVKRECEVRDGHARCFADRKLTT